MTNPNRQAGGLKAKATNLARDPYYYRTIGRKGGAAPTKTPKGFAAMSEEKRRAAGKLGAERSLARRREHRAGDS